MRHGTTLFALLLLLSLHLLVVGCGDAAAPERSDETLGASTPLSPSAGPEAEGPKIKVKDPSGALLVSLKGKDYGWKLVGPGDAELGKLKRDGDEIKFKDPSGTTVAKVKPKDERGCKLSDGAGTTKWRLKWKDGLWDVRGATDDTVAVIRQVEGSWVLAAPAGAILGRVVVRPGECKVVDAAGTERFTVGDAGSGPGAALMGLDAIPLVERCALYVFIRDAGW